MKTFHERQGSRKDKIGWLLMEVSLVWEFFVKRTFLQPRTGRFFFFLALLKTTCTVQVQCKTIVLWKMEYCLFWAQMWKWSLESRKLIRLGILRNKLPGTGCRNLHYSEYWWGESERDAPLHLLLCISAWLRQHLQDKIQSNTEFIPDMDLNRKISVLRGIVMMECLHMRL